MNCFKVDRFKGTFEWERKITIKSFPEKKKKIRNRGRF